MGRRLKVSRYFDRINERRKRLAPGVTSSWVNRGIFFFIDYWPAVPGSVPEKMVFAELMRRHVNFFFGFYFGDIPWTNNEEALRPDFILPDYRIIIELQGIYWHSREGKFAYDLARYILLESAGYTVHFLTDEEVLRDVVAAVNTIPELVNPVIQGNFFAVAENPFDPTASPSARLRQWARVPSTKYKSLFRGAGKKGIITSWDASKEPPSSLVIHPLFSEDVFAPSARKKKVIEVLDPETGEVIIPGTGISVTLWELLQELRKAGRAWVGTDPTRQAWWNRFSPSMVVQSYVERYWWL